MTMLAFANFVLDPVRLRLCRRDTGELVPLTPKVFEALAYLVAHQNEVLDKETLLEGIWPGLVVEENSLTQTISTLRRALGEARGENRFIVTLPGRGYRFVAAVSPFESNPDATGPGRRATTALRSLAVLPFKPLAANQSNESLELGMTEALISGLAAIPGVVVPPMSSVRGFNAIDQDPIAAGRTLRVQAVLEGSLQRDGEHLRVSARLMRVADGQQHWAGRFDVSFTTIFDVQDTLARQVTEALASEFGIAGLPPAVRRYTRDAEAYQLYLNGRFAWTHSSDVSLPLAINYFQQALARDPNYALAYAGLADCHILIGVFGMRPPHDAYPIAREATNRALAINPMLAAAHATLGHIQVQYEQDWTAADRSYARAIELDPLFAPTFQYLAILLGFRGEFDKALAIQQRVLELEPLWMIARANVGMLLYYARRYEEAVVQLEPTLELDPSNDHARSFLGRAYLRLGQPERALEAFRRRRSPSPGSFADVAQAMTLTGDRAGASAELAQLRQLSQQRYVPAYDLAAIHACLNQTDEAVRAVEQTLTERGAMIGWMRHDPAFDALRGEPRYEALAATLPPISNGRALAAWSQ
jgi:DNA-binding winged helix-turn-helix (wHTH) protein/tetratricopeptide (TPR) repeat protein